MQHISVKLPWIPLFLSYLEYQYEQQQGRHDGVHLSLSGQGVEICEGIPRVLQVWCPLLFSYYAAAQVYSEYRRC